MEGQWSRICRHSVVQLHGRARSNLFSPGQETRAAPHDLLAHADSCENISPNGRRQG